MNIKITTEKLFQTPCEAALLFIFQKDGKPVFGKETVDFPKEALQDFTAEANQSMIVYVSGCKAGRVMFVGLGEEEKFSEEIFVRALGSAALELQKKKLTLYALALPSSIRKIFGAQRAGLFCVKAVQLAQYQFSEFKNQKGILPKCQELVFCEIETKEKKKFEKGIRGGIIIADAINITRHYGDLPSMHATPTYLANQARAIAKKYKNVKVQVLGKKEMEKMNMGGILAVSKGSRQEPVCIVLEYWGTAKSQAPVVFVGKGITFDSGGINIKPSEGGLLDEMKADMGGGAAVLGVIKATAALGYRKNVVAIVPACENLLGDNAYKPGDIIRSMSAKTIEVQNTDAEGRIILADGLHYAKRYRPKVVIDFATLTGACMVALGFQYDGIFTRDEKLIQEIFEASKNSMEPLWRLPLDDDFSASVKGENADVINVGKDGRWGGASSAAAFLEQFVGDERWAHIDIAPRAFITKVRPWMRSGATGAGVHLGVEIVKISNMISRSFL